MRAQFVGAYIAVAPWLMVVMNAFVAGTFFVILHVRRDRMSEVHQLAYLAVCSGMIVNIVLFIAGVRDVPWPGEIIAYAGWTGFAGICLSKNKAPLERFKRLDAWI